MLYAVMVLRGEQVKDRLTFQWPDTGAVDTVRLLGRDAAYGCTVTLWERKRKTYGNYDSSLSWTDFIRELTDVYGGDTPEFNIQNYSTEASSLVLEEGYRRITIKRDSSIPNWDGFMWYDTFCEFDVDRACVKPPFTVAYRSSDDVERICRLFFSRCCSKEYERVVEEEGFVFRILPKVLTKFVILPDDDCATALLEYADGKKERKSLNDVAALKEVLTLWIGTPILKPRSAKGGALRALLDVERMVDRVVAALQIPLV